MGLFLFKLPQMEKLVKKWKDHTGILEMQGTDKRVKQTALNGPLSMLDIITRTDSNSRTERDQEIWESDAM